MRGPRLNGPRLNWHRWLDEPAAGYGLIVESGPPGLILLEDGISYLLLES